MADKAPLYTYTNESKDTVVVPNLGTLAPDETSRATELVLENPILKRKEVKEEAQQDEAESKDTKVLRGIDRTSKKDNDEVEKK